ncbi:MAG: serine hydrolase domain-containing protein [Terrimicrobiaceae bacterium]
MRAVEEAFRRNFEEGREVGAAVCVFKDGEEVLSLQGGFRDATRSEPWEDSTLVLVWSATKAPASACALHAIHAAGLNLETMVAEFWPEFAQSGKELLTLGHVMTHRAGLFALDDPSASLLDRESVVRAIERQCPQIQPNAGPAYAPRVFGFLLDEIVRRLAGGESLGARWRRVFAEPLGLDFWIGLPEIEHHRVATMLAPKPGPPAKADELFIKAFADPNSPTRRAFASPAGLAAASAMNAPQVRSASLPAMGGIGSARALAKFFAMLANGGTWQGREFLAPEILAWIAAPAAQGFDPVLQREMAFSAGFTRDPIDADGRKIRSMLGPSTSAFGHAGAGGSLAFADPSRRLGFAYVMNQMELGVLPHERCQSLVRALYS